MARIHPTAVVDPKAELHESVEVGAYSVIHAGVKVGAGTKIHAHVVLDGPMTIGANNTIYPFASLGAVSQDKTAKYDDATRVEIGDGNTIREYVTINRGTLKEQGVTRLGDDNWLMACAHVAHDCVIGSHTILANNVLLAGHVTIDDWVILGGASGVHQFCRIGEGAFSGGGSIILGSVPPYVMVQGNPAEPRAINSEGLKRRGHSAEDIGAVKDAYKLIYLSGKPMAEIKAELAELGKGNPHVARMSEFVETAKRPLAR
ncbi:MAG TPA: acyl-ACP--UDP-N-acetylglucosamine O-acyltransferase [Verrucomicrobiae bacterium]|nr:acyl-ACP--UDP-N-acetylglucosamine O-acyltransferase [Verrucomicrobiae bacterium]